MADISQPALNKATEIIKEHVKDIDRLDTAICDVSKEPDVENIVGLVEKWGGVDVMFNNAGIMHGQDADAIDTPEKIWDMTQNINVKVGVFFI